jgi:hypothetical protein
MASALLIRPAAAHEMAELASLFRTYAASLAVVRR